MDLTALEFWANFGVGTVFGLIMLGLYIRQGREHKDETKQLNAKHREDFERVLDVVEVNTESIQQQNTTLAQLVSLTEIRELIRETQRDKRQ